MTYFFGFIALIYLAYQWGKHDGKWGLFIGLMLLIVIAVIASCVGYK